MAGVAFAVEGDGVGFATESYAASALYTTLANLSADLWRIRRARGGLDHRHERVQRLGGLFRHLAPHEASRLFCELRKLLSLAAASADLKPKILKSLLNLNSRSYRW